MREYLIDQGYTEVNSPKSVIRQAYADQLISRENLWIAMLNDRNATSHLYDAATAAQIYQRIVSDYLPLFDQATRVPPFGGVD